MNRKKIPDDKKCDLSKKTVKTYCKVEMQIYNVIIKFLMNQKRG